MKETPATYECTNCRETFTKPYSVAPWVLHILMLFGFNCVLGGPFLSWAGNGLADGWHGLLKSAGYKEVLASGPSIWTTVGWGMFAVGACLLLLLLYLSIVARCPACHSYNISKQVTAQGLSMHAGDADVLKSSTMNTKSGIFSFEGRIGLEEYWGNVAVSVIIGIGISFMAETRLAGFASLLLPCYLWYVLAFMSKRCHDLGDSGAFILIPFYPLVLAFGKGDVGANDYGPNPNDLAKHMFETVLVAEQGFVRAQYNLGICYHDGTGVPRDKVEAVKCYRNAAEMGFAPAQFNLGVCYFNGAGVAKNEIEAYAYVNLAGITYEAARKHLAILEKKMTADQIDAGKKRTKELQKEIEAKIAAKTAEDANKAGK